MAMTITDDDFQERFRKARTLRENGDLSGAGRLIKEMLQLRPDETSSWMLMGHIYWEQKDISNAVECFRKATILNPFLELASLGLYHTLWSSGLREEALDEMRRFLKMSASEEYEKLLKAFRDAET